jgi:flavin reductase (DIM6/NTAB) family NADH-FMN oxidoreductase RutF
MTERAVDSVDFRRHVSLFATGVAVISCSDSEGELHGASVNSFVSVSLDPPTVMVSLRPGRAHDIVRATGRYGASVLLEDQEHASNHFARQRDGAVPPEFVTRDVVPTLKDCLAWFECEVLEEVTIHDHVLFIARVTACGSGAGTPLIFYASKYHGPPTPVELLLEERD